MERGKRNPTLDVIRIIALFCVVSVHFFKQNGFYDEIVMGKRMYVMSVMRNFFMICVPMFLILTGYLMNQKKVCKRYYLGVIKTIRIYLFASMSCIVYKILVLKMNFPFKIIIGSILDFSAADYSWYIEMYIGLFLLIPFLNVLWNNLTSKRQKIALIITFLILTSVPSMLNIYVFDVEGWWSTPGLSREYRKLFPEWWQRLYPITYYFIGCFIKEFQVSLKKIVNIILILIAVAVFGTFNYYRSYGYCFINDGPWQEWGALPNVIMTVLVFIFLLHIDFTGLSNRSKKFLKTISDACLGAYLVSWIFDDLFYPVLNDAVSYMPNRLEYYAIIVPVIFICSLMLSCALNAVYLGIVKIVCILKIKRRANI